jgi:hypothetical protein
MCGEQVIDARRELHLRQVASAGQHHETSVRQRCSEQFGIRRRRRDAVFDVPDSSAKTTAKAGG